MADLFRLARNCLQDPGQNADDCFLFEYLVMVASIMPRFFDRTPFIVVPVDESETPQANPWDVAIAAAQMQAVQAVVELREAQFGIPTPEPALKARLQATDELRAGLERAISWANDEIGALEKQLRSLDG